jgi:hypothetical protein
MAVTPPMAVVETEEFLNHAKAILTETERSGLVAHLRANPEAGRLVPGTGGVRAGHLRKNEKADLSQADNAA